MLLLLVGPPPALLLLVVPPERTKEVSVVAALSPLLWVTSVEGAWDVTAEDVNDCREEETGSCEFH